AAATSGRGSGLYRGALPRHQRPEMRAIGLFLVAVLTAAMPAAAAEPGGATAPTAKAAFAGGCFWCMEPPFEALDGVISVTAGYTGGTKQNPTYEEGSAGGPGHPAAIQGVYDPTQD